MNHYFPNDPVMKLWLEDPTPSSRPNDFKGKNKNFPHMVSGSTWQLTFKELLQNQLM